ncbi:MAG TPA: cyclopropane-fatty-acyl-phospholipid synthase family protein [Acidimicrobiales bacterium]|nr:cyclopropane-fatty-acyl-phospholipid synthase family protein [Acidimicrobiales bacterium]
MRHLDRDPTPVGEVSARAGSGTQLPSGSSPRTSPAAVATAGSVAALVASVVGPQPTVAFECWDGSRLGPARTPVTVVVRSPDALRRILGAPGELGFARAWVVGDIDVQGDLYAALALGDTVPSLKLTPRQIGAALRLLGVGGLRPLPPPPEEARLRGRRHGPRRDAAAVVHHYDVSNAFYGMVLGPSLTYSCAVWEHAAATLEEAQAAKHELICRKLELGAGMRLLDVGCGWGSMLLHAARRHGVQAVGVTLSAHQADLARRRVADAGLADRVEIRVQDYRDVDDGPYDAISSIGMFEHVGRARLGEYFSRLRALLRPGGRVLNHGISRPPGGQSRFSRRGFLGRYVFPDGELHAVGSVISAMQDSGLEVRHMESLREHYARTLRAWVANLEAHWDAAVAEVGERRARIWRLYMAASALGFEHGDAQVHQILALPATCGRTSEIPARPRWDATPLRDVVSRPADR